MTSTEEPIVIKQTYNKPSSIVWDALTRPERLRGWFFDNIPDFKAEVGFEARFDIESDGRIFPHHWRVTEVDAPKKLVYDWRHPGYDGDAFVMFELVEDGDATHLTLSFHIRESFPQDIPEFKRESGVAGWTYFIQEQLKNYLEG